MPGEDGYEFIKKVRALRKKNGGRIPAIALTGFAGLDDKSKAMAAGLSSAYFKTCRLGQSNF
jgi:CheY-like chemotaxis protein